MCQALKKIFLLTAISLAAAGAESSAAELVKDGKPVSTIIIDANPRKSANLAALELQYHIEKMTGAKIPITNAPDTVKGTKVFVGESRGTKELGLKNDDFKNQEYLVKIKGDSIILMGKDKEDRNAVDYGSSKTFPDIFDEIGTCYAVYDFLEKLGVRWYLPAEIGISFIPAKSLSVNEFEIRRQPFMRYRDIANSIYSADFMIDNIDKGNDKFVELSQRETLLFKLRQRQGGNKIIINHSFYTYYNRFLETHPDWFARGYEGKPPQLCYSNPDVLKQVIQDARDFFDGKKDAAELISNVPKGFKSDIFPVFPMDNSMWCKCPQCQAQLKPKAERGAGQFSNDRASNYIFGFVNKVAAELKKTHPDKYIGAGTYAEFCYPPEKIKLETNIMTVHCLHNRMVYAKHIQENDNAVMDAWKYNFPDTPKLVWLYYCFPSLTATYQQFRCFPGFFAHHIKPQIQRYVDAKVQGIFIEPSYMGKPWKNAILMDQLDIYLTWKLADNPDTNANDIINDFFKNYYGPAAEPMRQFYLLIENAHCDPANYPSLTKDQNDEIAWKRLGTEERISKLNEFMEQAKKLASSDPFKQRVEILDKGIWQYMLKGRKDNQERETMMAPTMQQATAPRLTNKEPGNPLTANWDNASSISLRYGMTADIIKHDLSGKLGHDNQFFYIMLEQKKVDTEKLYDKEIVWLNDEWELFFAKQRGIPYRQLGVDAAGKCIGMDYQGTVQQAWDFKGKVLSQKNPETKNWKVYITIPLDDLVLNGIKPGEMLYFNVIRAEKTNYLGSWIPTFGSFKTPARFGEIYLEK